MKDGCKNFFNTMLKAVGERYQFKAISRNLPSATLHGHTHGVIAGVRTSLEGYTLYHFAPSTVKLSDDFNNFLMRNFIVKISETFDIESHAEPAKYAKMLFQSFVHTGENHVYTMDDIVINNARKAVSDKLNKKYPAESEVFHAFQYDFNTDVKTWEIDDTRLIRADERNTFPTARPTTLYLGHSEKNYIQFLLQQLTKLWIIHQCVSHIDHALLKKEAFFDVPDLQNTLENLQKEIGQKIEDVINIPLEQRESREAEFHLVVAKDTTDLSPRKFDLMQRISFAKWFYGHANYDVHYDANRKSTLLSKVWFYLHTYANVDLSKAFLKIIVKNFNKSGAMLRTFILREEKTTSLRDGFLKLLKSLYMTIWFPFLATYFMVSGLTSMPFSWFRKALSIPFGSKWDGRLTIVEIIKDSILICLGAPLAYEIFTAVGAFCLGTTGLAFGTASAFYIGAAVISPYLLLTMIGHPLFTPGWYQTCVNSVCHPPYYRKQSDFMDVIDLLKGISSNAFISIHGFFAGSALVLYGSTAIIGYGVQKLKTFFKAAPPKQCTQAEIKIHTQNLNHTQKFRQLLGKLIGKIQDKTCDDVDNQLLATLYTCQLEPVQKQLLQTYLEEKMKEDNLEGKVTYKLALNQIQKDTYLPSWKLIDRLQKELTPENALKGVVDNIHESYTQKLAAYL